MPNLAISRSAALVALLCSVLLSACGGGSSGGGQAVAPNGPPGTLDPSFGTGGTVVTTGAAALSANAMALQPDGKIVVVGSSGVDAGKTFYLARYNGDGSLDTSFGRNGTVLTSIGAGDAQAHAVALQPDGLIVTAGDAAGLCVVVRYRGDGALDVDFGEGGVAYGPEGACTAVAVQADAKLLAAGGPSSEWAVLRFNQDGRPDPSFGIAGRSTLDCAANFLPGACHVSAMLLQPDAKIVVAGSYTTIAAAGPYNSPLFLIRSIGAITRLNVDGTSDTSFGTGGIVTTRSFSEQSFLASVVTRTNASIVVAGSSGSGSRSDFLLADYSNSGTLDPGFGTGGVTMTHLGDQGTTDGANALALQANGKIDVAGSSTLASGQSEIAIARYATDGELDAAFGNAGKVLTTLGSSTSASAITIQPDGRILVTGTVTTEASTQAIFVARYFGDAV